MTAGRKSLILMWKNTEWQFNIPTELMNIRKEDRKAAWSKSKVKILCQITEILC